MNDSWMKHALCRGVDPRIFFPSSVDEGHPRTAHKAQQVCNRCPVFEQCEEYADTLDERHGVWAGINRNRNSMPGPMPPPPHGTEARARRHRRAGEEPCGPCLAGERLARQLRKARATA